MTTTHSDAGCSESIRFIRVLIAAATLAAAGCGSDFAAPTAPSLASVGAQRTARVQAEQIDVGGSWTWTETVKTMLPPFLAEILGIEPEGIGHPRDVSR